MPIALTNPFVKPLEQLLLWLNHVSEGLPLPGMVSSWAVALILVSIVIKLVTYPLTISQMRSMRGVQELQPKLKELQERFKGDREKLAQAQMELYRAHGVSPWGGCLPLIIQMVILIGLYSAIQNLRAQGLLEGERFFWIPNLAQCEPSPMCRTEAGMGIPILIILMVLSQFAYQKFATPPTTDPQAQAMNSTMMLMPLMFAFLFAKMPAGLVLYYTAFNIVSVVMQAGMMRWWQKAPPVRSAPGGSELGSAGVERDVPNEEGQNGSESRPIRRRRRKKVR